MAIAGLVGFGFGSAFLVMGAWPIFGFCGAEWLLFYVCFRLNYRAARMRERGRNFNAGEIRARAIRSES